MVKVAIFGAGIGAAHLSAYQALSSRFSVVYMVDLNLNRAREVVEDYPAQISDNIDDVLTDPTVELIDICLPPHLHVPVALKALEAGKHVICEKPIATSLAQTQALKRAIARSQRQYFPVFQYRFGKSIQQLRQLIDAGLTGRAYVAALETHWSRDAEYYAAPWRGTWAREMGGAVLGHAIHSHDLLCYLFGKVSAVTAALSTRVNDIETEDCAALTFEMASGGLATSNVTLGCASDETRMRFIFENLTATSKTNPYAPGSEPWTFSTRHPSQSADIEAVLRHPPKVLGGFEGFLTEVHKAVTGEDNYAVTFEEGVSSIELVSAIYHSARTQTRVMLPLGSDHAIYQGWQP